MKHEIEIEGLPEGWEPVAYAVPCIGDHVFYCGRIKLVESKMVGCWLIVKKKQPRRIVLEETEGKYLGNQVLNIDGIHISIMTARKWREVKEGDLSLHNADDKESLRLTREQCRELLQFSSSAIEMIKDFLRSKS